MLTMFQSEAARMAVVFRRRVAIRCRPDLPAHCERLWPRAADRHADVALLTQVLLTTTPPVQGGGVVRVHRAVLLSTCRQLQAVLGGAGCCGEAQVSGRHTQVTWECHKFWKSMGIASRKGSSGWVQVSLAETSEAAAAAVVALLYTGSCALVPGVQVIPAPPLGCTPIRFQGLDFYRVVHYTGHIKIWLSQK